MSFLQRILGIQEREQVMLPESLALDLLRLKKVMQSLGVTSSTLKLKRLNDSEQLHRINKYLGDRLALCTARERLGVVKAFLDADASLPADVTGGGGDATEVRSALENGCADLGITMTPEQLEAIHAHLRSKPVLLGHDAHGATGQVPSLSDVPADKNYACYNYLDLWSSPHLMEFATQKRFQDLAQAYLGCTPTLYSMNAFWSFPHRQPNKASQVFHRDWEDYRSLVIFTQLTPVDGPQDGAHYYVETSHEPERFEKSLRARDANPADIEALSTRDEVAIAPLAMKLFGETAHRFDGPAGRSFCGDGYGLHRANVPQSRPRLLLWMRFGNFFNDTAYKMQIGIGNRAVAERTRDRIPATPRHQYVFRYMTEALSAV